MVLSQGILSRDSSPEDLPWETHEVLRIEALSDTQVFTELQRIFDGYDYSWVRINQLLQQQLDEGVLEFTLEDGSVIFEWNNLCGEKRIWERRGHLSASCSDFYRDCLINLKILPAEGGLNIEGRKLHLRLLDTNKNSGPRLVTTKIEPPILLGNDMLVVRKWENLTIEDFSSNNEESSWSASDSGESEYEQSEYASSECLEAKLEDGSEEDSDISYEEADMESEESKIESEEL